MTRLIIKSFLFILLILLSHGQEARAAKLQGCWDENTLANNIYDFEFTISARDSVPLETSGLSPGSHVLYYRVVNDLGVEGLIAKKIVYVEPDFSGLGKEDVHMLYSWNTNAMASPSDGTSALGPDPSGGFCFDASLLPPGSHTLYFQPVLAGVRGFIVRRPVIVFQGRPTVLPELSISGISPQNTIVSGNSITWDVSGPFTKYSFYLGTAPGRRDVLQLDNQTSGSITTGSLPTGPAYLTVWAYHPPSGKWQTQSLEVVVEAPRPNSAPIASEGSSSMDENTSVLIDLKGSDPDGDSLTFEIVVQPAHGRLDRVDSDSFRYTPNRDFTGTDQFQFIANDGRQNSLPAVISISVRDTGSTSESEFIPLKIVSYDQKGIRFQLDTGFSTGTAQLWYADSLPSLIASPQPVLSLEAPLVDGHQFQLDMPGLNLDSPNISAFFLAELMASSNPDKEGPIVLVSSPQNQAIVSTPLVTILGTVSDAGRGGNGVQQLTVNGQLVASAVATGNGSASWQASVNLTPGQNNIQIQARDTVGNQSVSSLTIFFEPLDTQKPALVITSPTPNSTLNSPNLLVTGTATDAQLGASGISRVTVNGQLVPGSQISGAGVLSWQMSITLSTGINLVDVRAVDGAGNESVTQMTVQYRPLDLTVPLLTVSSPANGAIVSDAGVLITGTASDSGRGNSGIASVTVNGTTLPGATASGSGSVSWQFAASLNLGSNQFTIIATDLAGNSAQSSLTVERIQGGPQPPVPGQPFVIESLNLRMVWVAPGTFQMGSPANEAGRFNNENLHEVSLSKGYWIAESELTVSQHQLITGLPAPGSQSDAQLPVVNLSWTDASGVCQKLNQNLTTYLNSATGFTFDLPTEAQWEFAARGGAGAPESIPFSTGQSLNHEQANFDARLTSDAQTQGQFRGQLLPVRSFQPNRLGLYDMHGNAWEWCSDWYGDYQTAAVTDPAGPSSGNTRIMRGGSWSLPGKYCRLAFRSPVKPSIRSGPHGLRLVLNYQN